MNNNDSLGSWLERFLRGYIVTERNLARNTQKSYRDTFKFFVPFLCTNLKRPDHKLAVRDITSSRVLQFLAHLEENRGCSVQTRNQRLAAIRAFARFVASRDPAHIAWCGHIRAIATKKAIAQPIEPLTKSEVDALLDVPNRKTLRGRNEYALLQFLYNTGARVSEATGLRVGDLQVGGRDGRHALVTLHGKGGKIRQCPLLPDTERALEELIRGRTDSDSVFVSRHRKPYTRSGVYRLVTRCAERVPVLAKRKISPHVLRHTIATELVRAEIDFNIIRALLGHVNIQTTNIYAEIDPETKAKALAICDAAEPGPSRPWKEETELMAFLNSL